jgi:hypothetical protein
VGPGRQRGGEIGAYLSGMSRPECPRGRKCPSLPEVSPGSQGTKGPGAIRLRRSRNPAESRSPRSHVLHHNAQPTTSHRPNTISGPSATHQRSAPAPGEERLRQSLPHEGPRALFSKALRSRVNQRSSRLPSSPPPHKRGVVEAREGEEVNGHETFPGVDDSRKRGGSLPPLLRQREPN